MDVLLHQFQSAFAALPRSFVETWGFAGYLVGWVFLVVAYGNLTFRPGGRWGLGWRLQAWDDHAFKAVLVTFAAIMLTGFLGSFIVLVPGAQTFESLKDLSVFVCVLLFGYPALLAVPFAYGISDLIEGVPPDFLLHWLGAYWINPSCFWMAVLLLGRNPDFRRLGVWLRYLVFVVIFLAVEPALWGYVTARQFPGGLSYYQITPALFFTTVITWMLAPFALMLLLPVARRWGWYAPEIPGHTRERDLLRSRWVGEARPEGLPIRLALALPFLTLLLATVGATASASLASSERSAYQLAGRLHEQLAANLALTLDNHFENQAFVGQPTRYNLEAILKASPAAQEGRVYLLDAQGLAASSAPPGRDTVWDTLRARQIPAGAFSFDVVTAQPLARETWLARAEPYVNERGFRGTLVTVLPSSSFLAGVQAASSQTAMVVMWSLLAALFVVVVLAGVVTKPLERIANAARELAEGRRVGVPRSRIHELGLLTRAFNSMAERTQEVLSRVSASESDFRGIFEGSIEGFFRTTAEGRFLIANPAMARILGYESPQQLVTEVTDTGGQLWAHREERERLAQQMAAKGSIEGVEVQMRRRDGSVIWVLLSSRVVHREGGWYEGFILDINDRKKTQLELDHQREHLEDLVAIRTRELEAARDNADAANQAKTLFLSNMSHEIRTPMNAVLGYAQLLGHADLPPAARDKVDTILKSGEHLLALIDEILEMARIESGRIEVHDTPFDPRTLLTDVSALFQVRVREKGLVLRVEPGTLPASVVSDQGKIRQILINLLSNAMKYTKHGSIALQGGVEGDHLRFEVADTGIGLSPEDLHRVFQAFERTSQGEQTAQGTGLGLAISRKHAELLGGSLEAESLVGSGSTFVLRVPLRTAAAVRVEPRLLPRFPVLKPGVSPRFLVVDDVALNRELLRGFLEPLGVHVDDAASGEAAYDHARRERPDIVLLDLRMPGWDGYETTRRLRSLPFGPELTILGISASAFDKDRREFLEAGIDGFLSKPFREQALYDLLAQAGVPFVQEEEAAEEPEALPAASQLSPDWIDELRKAVARGSLARVRELAENADLPAVASWLKRQTARYDLETIREWLGA